MRLCDACQQEEGTIHVTVRVTVFRVSSESRKIVQFWLCDTCEKANKQVLANDANQRRRVALRLTQEPSFFSKWRDWRGRQFERDPLRMDAQG